MPDVFSRQKRSEVMSRIRHKGNKDTELKMIGIFRTNGISGWRRNSKVFGKPDFVFAKYKIAIFVDGCFWHGCPEHSNIPQTNQEFWTKKIGSTKVRDLIVTTTLQSKGWKVLRFWEHELRDAYKVAAMIAKTRGSPKT